MNWIQKAWRAFMRVSGPETPRRVNVSEHPDAVFSALRKVADEESEEFDELFERTKGEINRRALLRRAAAMIATVGLVQIEGLPDVDLRGGGFMWNSANADPLADILAAKKRIEAFTGVESNAVLAAVRLGAGHRAYILAHFGLDVARAETRAELSRELGMRVELAQPA